MNKRLRIILLVLIVALPRPLFAETDLSEREAAQWGLAQTLNNKGDFAQAVELLAKLHAAYPHDEKIAFEYIKALGYSRDPSAAVRMLDERRFLHYDQDRLFALKASIFESHEMFEEASGAYAAEYERTQDPASAHKAAQCYAWAGDLNAARAYYGRLSGSPYYTEEIRREHVQVLLAAGDYRGALALADACDFRVGEDKKILLALAQAHIATKDHASARALFDELVSEYPADSSVLSEYGSYLYARGQTSDAQHVFERILETAPDDQDSKRQLAEIFASMQRFEAAHALIDELIADGAGSKELQLLQARMFSWQGNYADSLRAYDSLLADHPGWEDARREKARVLGWKRDFQGSQDMYATIAGAARPGTPAFYERQQKRALYAEHFRSARRSGKKLLSLEPNNAEALFDLAYSSIRLKDWNAARAYYARLLALYPNNKKARDELARVDFYAAMKTVSADLEWNEKDSASRDADMRSYAIGVTGHMPLGVNSTLTAYEKTAVLETSRLSVNTQTLGLGLSYRLPPWFELDLGYGYRLYSDTVDDTHLFHERVHITPHDMISFAFSHERSDVLENSATLSRSLQKDAYRLRLELVPYRRIIAGADYQHARYSDPVHENRYGFDLRYVLFFEPSYVSVLYRFEEYGFNTERDYFFTPSSFHTNALALDWRQHMPGRELVWGMDNTYMHARYTVRWDVHSQRGHSIYGGLYHEWNRSVVTEVKWEKTMYEHDGIYSEESLQAVLAVRF